MLFKMKRHCAINTNSIIFEIITLISISGFLTHLVFTTNSNFYQLIKILFQKVACKQLQVCSSLLRIEFSPQSYISAAIACKTLTISTNEIYRNIPAVMENIQGLAAISDEIGTPMKNPTKAVREEKRLAISAFLKDSPSLIKIAKSPIGKLESVYN